MKTGPTVLFRCDASPEIGLGHVVRCTALADELHEVHHCRIAFAMRDGPLGFERVRQSGYPVYTPARGGPFDYSQWLREAIRATGARVLVLDVRDDLLREPVERVREQGILVVTLDDLSERRLAADLAFYPPVPQVNRLDWSDFQGCRYAGWEWVVLRQEFARPPARASGRPPLVLITMGGSDPAGFTLKAVEALNQVEMDFQTVAVLGPGFVHDGLLQSLLATTRRPIEIRRNVDGMASLMARADLAVASFGVTAYELAAVGVPAIFFCLTEDHAESAAAFVDAGMALSLGEYRQGTATALSQEIQSLLVDEPRHRRMAQAARERVNGRGTENIAREVIGALNDGIS